MAHAAVQVSEQPPPPEAIPARPGHRCKHTNSPRSQPPEQKDEKERMEDLPGVTAGAACPHSDGSLLRQLAQSRCVRQAARTGRVFTPPSASDRIGLMISARGAGACGCSPFSGLACGWLRALFGGEHPSPCPHARLPLPPLLPDPSLRQAALAAAGPSACFHVCDVSDCVCRVLVYMGKEAAEGGGRDDFEGGLRQKKKKKNQQEKNPNRGKKKRKNLREIPLFSDMKQKAFIFMAIRDG